MSDNRHYDRLVDSGKPVGEVIGVDKFLVRASGLHPVAIHSLVMFEDGSKGLVYHVYEDYVVILHLGTSALTPGMTVVVQHHELVSKVGEDFIGRVISVNGEPLDGKGPLAGSCLTKSCRWSGASAWPSWATARPVRPPWRCSWRCTKKRPTSSRSTC
jgi:F0F1-type ATP synthase alpha subunit